MRITIQDDFDLQKIADSGQCFRFNKCGEGYSVVAGDKYLFRVEFYSNYGEHYFEMIDSENDEGLFTLIRPGLDAEIFSDEAVRAKAQEVLDYYEISVRNDLSDNMRSMVTVLLPEHIRITIPETLNSGGNRVVKHDVDIITSEGSYEIQDDIPIRPDITLTQVSLLGEELFTCGNTYTSTQMLDLMGESNRTTYYPSTESFSVYYDGLILVFDVSEYADEEDWVGVLTTIKILGDSVYTIGNELHPGMSRTEVLEMYPYLHPDYIVEVDNGYEDCNVEISLGPDDNISYIRITVV